MLYGEVVERSLSIFWRRRYIWLLGALGGGEMVGGAIGNLGISGQGPGGASETGGVAVPDQVSSEFGPWFTADLPLLGALVALLVLFFLVYFFISCVAVGGTVRAAAEHDAERPFNLSLAWRAGRHTFLPILGLRLLGLLIALPAVAIAAGLVALAVFSAIRGRSEGIVTAIVAGIVVVPLLWVLAVALGLVWTLAIRAIVLDQVRVRGALRRGLHLLRQRPGRVALLWLIALGLAIASGIAASLAAGLLLLPFLAILAGTYAVGGVSATLTVGAVLLFLYIVLSVFLNGAVGSFLTSYWTLAYRRLDLDPTSAGPQQPAVA